MPPPPPGFEMVGGTGAVPPPPPGFEPVHEMNVPPPPPGFEPVQAETRSDTAPDPNHKYTRMEALGGLATQIGHNIKGVVEGLLTLPQRMGEAGIRERTGDTLSPQEMGPLALEAGGLGLRMGRSPVTVGKAPIEAKAGEAPKPVEPAAAEVPPPPKELEPVADNGVFRPEDVPPPPKGFEPVSPQEAGVAKPRESTAKLFNPADVDNAGGIASLRERTKANLSPEELKKLDRAYAQTEYSDLEQVQPKAVTEVDRPLIVYRGVVGDGRIFESGKFISTSDRTDPADIFSYNHAYPDKRGTVAEIHVEPGVKAFVPESGMKHEVVLAPDTQFDIVERGTKTHKNGQEVDTLKVVARAPSANKGLKPRDLGKSVRAMEADVQRIAAEQDKRQRLLGDRVELENYAAEKGISSIEMENLLRANYADNIPRLAKLKAQLETPEAAAQKETELSRAKNIKFKDLGAAASGIPEERTPVSKPEVQAVADDLNRLRQSGVADRAEIAQRMEATPPEFKNPALQEKFYHAIENPTEMAKLSPEEFALFEKHIQPMRDELAQLYQTVKKYGGEDMVADPTYVHRIAKGHAPAYDTLSGNADNPIAGTRSLNRTTSALQGRKFFALQDEAGNRYVVSKGDGASTIWTNGKPTQMTTELELRPGTEVQLGGKTFDVKQATTNEIEANSPIRYHKSAAVNTADALVRMREVARNVEALDKFKTDLQATGRARPMVGGRAPEGFVETKIPQLRGTAFEPKIAHAFDDFYKPGLEGLEGLRKINQFATGSIFWNPLPHIENVAAHWFTGRGWDWIRPGPVKGFATDAGRAIRETVTQGPEYQRLLREGSGLVYGGVKNADFYQQMGRRFGMDIEKNWSDWKPVFDKFGLKTPYEATVWWYGKMRNVLWAANDMFMLHRVFELERRGLGAREAIKEAEKHIPNYRIPSEVVGSRQFSRILQEPALTIFSRYHYGMWKSYMNVVSDMVKGSGKERLDAAGNLAALGVLMYAVYPAIDTALQMVTGDPKAQKLRRGSASIPTWAKDLYSGDLSFPQFLGNVITMAPATKEGMQQFTGKDWFTGQDLGNVIPRVEHATKALVSPYNTAAQMTDQRSGTRSAGRTALDTLVGAKNTSERTTQGRERAKIAREKADRRQEERPTGPISQGYKALKDKVREYKGP